MSFILDAIKKSEHERQKNRQPDVHSLQNAGAYSSERKSGIWRILSFLLSILLVAALLSWLWPRISEQFELSNKDRSPSNVSVSQRGNSGESETSVSKPAPSTNTFQPAIETVSPITDPDAELPPRHLIKELWELPADFQSTVPDMEYSFHVFSKDPARRTIFINGRTVKEGQMVASGLKLRVITETGVIFHFRDRFFHVDIVEKW